MLLFLASMSFLTPLRYPVILSIENHCSVAQQKKMAQYLVEILGDKLDLSTVNNKDPNELPSPESLKGKILVKVIEDKIRHRSDLAGISGSLIPFKVHLKSTSCCFLSKNANGHSPRHPGPRITEHTRCLNKKKISRDRSELRINH